MAIKRLALALLFLFIPLSTYGQSVQRPTSLNGSGGGGSGTVNSGTSNRLSKYVGAATVGDSTCTDDGTTLTCTGTGGVSVPKVTTTGTSGAIDTTAITAPSTPSAGLGSVYEDSTTKKLCLKDDAGTVTCTVNPNVNKRGIPFTIGDPSGSALTVASTTTDYITVPYACTISAYNLLIDAGTITVKFWKVATGTAIPTSSNSINTSGVGISSGTAIHSTTVSDFTSTAVTANDIMAMNVTAVATAKFVTGTLQCDQ